MATTDFSPDLAGAAEAAHARAAVVAAARAAPGFVLGRCRQWSEAEAGRLALWAPVALGAGVVLYFSLKFEPPAWVGAAFLLAAATTRFGFARARFWTGAALCIALGFAAADWRASRVDAPILARELTPTTVTGRLVSVDEAPKNRRLVIDVVSIDRLDSAALPERVRVSWRGKEFDALPGDVVLLRAGLAPPPAPAAPGGFDFARTLYFERIGAVGYAVTAPQKIGATKRSPGEQFSTFIERARLKITRRILEATGDSQGGAIVAASVTGHRGAISEETQAALRDSGLAHLVAISGLNMALATGLIFFAVRGGLAMIEPVALRYPIKKWAAVAALASGLIYLLLSGGEWSALRAFIMTAIVFVAILFDRSAVSLRNVAIAATIIIAIAPEAVMHPGFQMSFAAVTALVAAYEWGATRSDPNRSFTLLARVRRYMVAIAVTDIIAASATAPFSLYHFNQSANFGLPANVAAIPIMGFAVMPVAVVGLLLMPFGLDGWAWRFAAAGVEAIIAVGASVASLPGAITTIAQWPPIALGVLVLGGLWLCLQSAPWRLGGLAAIPIAAGFILTTAQPSLFVSSEGENAGIVAHSVEDERGLYLFNVRKDKFSASVWKEQTGLDPRKAPTLAVAEIGRCDPAGCAALVKGARVAISSEPLELAEDCRRADLVIALYPVAARAKSQCATRLIDRRSVWDNGAQAVWIDGNEIRVRTVNELRGVRPWTVSARLSASPSR